MKTAMVPSRQRRRRVLATGLAAAIVLGAFLQVQEVTNPPRCPGIDPQLCDPGPA